MDTLASPLLMVTLTVLFSLLLILSNIPKILELASPSNKRPSYWLKFKLSAPLPSSHFVDE